jgi:hypothetical protein
MMADLLASTSPKIDVIIGDYLAEFNIAYRALELMTQPELGYEAPFLAHIAVNADQIIKSGVKIVVDAGALNAKGMAQKVDELFKARGANLKVGGEDFLVFRLSFCSPTASPLYFSLDCLC